MQLHDIIGTLVLIAVIAVPFGAVLHVYRENPEPYLAGAKRVLAFDPRHPALHHDNRS